MSSTVVSPKKKYAAPAPQKRRASTECCNANGAKKPGVQVSKPIFREGLGSHPLWQALLDEIEANRQADIAEMNRLADMELENLEAEK